MSGYWLACTTFLAQDDEGYILWSIRDYVAHGGLYANVYSQYGPFFFNFHHLLGIIAGLSFDSETGRLLMLFHWIGASTLAGALVWHLTRSLIAMAATAGLTFAHLWVMISEPMHPGGLLTLLAALGAFLGMRFIESGRPRCFATTAALLGTAMFLTKINVGGFFLISAGTWMLVHAGGERFGRYAALLAALACATVPLFLMRGLSGQASVATHAMVFTASALALVLAMNRTRQGVHTPRTWLLFLGTGQLAAAAILLATWWRGTPVAALWQGIVAAPLQHADVFHLPVAWLPGVRELAISLLAFAALILARKARPAWVTPALAGMRLLAGALFLVAGAGLTLHLPWLGLAYGTTFAWIMVVPLHEGPATPAEQARLWVAWVFVWQSLHAYPVAGSQIGFGTFLWVPVFITGWHEALEYAAGSVRRLQPAIRGAGGLALIAAAVAAAGGLGCSGHARYASREPLDLPGARNLRLAPETGSALRLLHENIMGHARLLFSLPGLYSFNIWTGCPPPTSANVTLWYSLLTERQQQAIIVRLKADPRACIVVQRSMLNTLQAAGFAPVGPLYNHLVSHFSPALRAGAYELWVQRGRSIAPYGVVRITRDSAGGRKWLELVVRQTSQSASRVEIRRMSAPDAILAELRIGQPHAAHVLPIDESGTPRGPVRQASVIPRLDSPAWIRIELPPETLPAPPTALLVRLLAEDGTVVGRLRTAD